MRIIYDSLKDKDSYQSQKILEFVEIYMDLNQERLFITLSMLDHNLRGSVGQKN